MSTHDRFFVTLKEFPPQAENIFFVIERPASWQDTSAKPTKQESSKAENWATQIWTRPMTILGFFDQ